MRASLLAVIASVGCETDLPPVWRIDQTRVLGMQVEIDGQDGVASVSPGDHVFARWIVATPGGELPDLAWSLATCSSDGASCRSELGPAVTGTVAQPEIGLDVPALDPLAIGVTGTVCDRASAACTQVFANLRATAGGPNHNPTLDGELAVGDDPWSASGGCEDAATRTVAASSEIELRWTATDHDREADADGRETLQLSTFVTAGDLEDHFAVVEGNGPLDHSIHWTAPAAGEPAPVYFTFVVRDGRGGLAVATRALCIVP